MERTAAHETVCIGNGPNDRAMRQEAALSIVIVGTEGAASHTLAAADAVTSDVVTAPELLRHPQRVNCDSWRISGITQNAVQVETRTTVVRRRG